jgi:L-fuculose-phosphate aldolase
VATSFAVAGIPLDRGILPEQVVILGSVPVAKYALTGSEDVPDSVTPYLKDYNAVLLANHGALTWGADMTQAFYRMEEVDYYAQITMNVYSIIGRANELSCDQVEELMTVRRNFGVETGGEPTCVASATNTKDVVRSDDVGAYPGRAANGAYPAGDDEETKLIEHITKLVLEKIRS